MTRDTLLDLARRVEQATGADNADNADSRLALFALGAEVMRACGQDYRGVNPLFSLDAAAALVPEGWTGTVHLDGKAMLYRDDREPYVAGLAATPALALTAAALRARAEETRDA